MDTPYPQSSERGKDLHKYNPVHYSTVCLRIEWGKNLYTLNPVHDSAGAQSCQRGENLYTEIQYMILQLPWFLPCVWVWI